MGEVAGTDRGTMHGLVAHRVAHVGRVGVGDDGRERAVVVHEHYDLLPPGLGGDLLELAKRRRVLPHPGGELVDVGGGAGRAGGGGGAHGVGPAGAARGARRHRRRGEVEVRLPHRRGRAAAREEAARRAGRSSRQRRACRDAHLRNHHVLVRHDHTPQTQSQALVETNSLKGGGGGGDRE
jgi:hypothetical protein